MTSFWMTQALAEEGSPPPLDPLDGDRRVDIAIVGGGYTGLWTAIELKSRDPSLDIVVIEKDVCGAGASGANAGMLVSMWVGFGMLEQLAGTAEALRLCHASVAAIEEIRRFAETHRIDLGWQGGGSIWGATCAAQSGHWHAAIDALVAHGIDLYDVLTAADIERLTGSPSFVAGVLDRSNAVIQPARLARGLRRAALGMGIVIHEGTRMTRLGRGTPPSVVTPTGRLTARKVILATYAWSLAVPELAPAAMVMCTDGLVTGPAPDAIEAAGFTGVPAMVDSRVFISSCRTTADGRIGITKSGGRLPYGARIDAARKGPRRPLAELRQVLGMFQPTLAGLPIAGTWAGPIDRSWDGLPLFGRIPGHPDILYGFGYSGSGVALSRLGARMLASLALDAKDEWSTAALVRQPKRAFPPEPFRYIGAHAVRTAIERHDRLDHEGRAAGPITRALYALKPASYKPA
ncbi:MAG: FAD-binding oxidoreductase [Hyphomicrobiaceae bacterium]